MKKRLQEVYDLRIAINDAVKRRILPLLMIALMASMGLFPAALSKGMGSDVQNKNQLPQ